MPALPLSPPIRRYKGQRPLESDESRASAVALATKAPNAAPAMAYATARRGLIAAREPSPCAQRAAAAPHAQCFRVACALPATAAAAAPLSFMAPRPPLSQTRAVAPVAEPTGGLAAASSGVGSTTVCSGRLTAGRCRSVVCVGLLPPQAGATRLPARHGRRAAWRQARGRRQRRWRLGRRRRARRRDACGALYSGVCMCADRHV